MRELQNRIQRAVLVQPGEVVTVADLGLAGTPEAGRRAAAAAASEAGVRGLGDAGSEAERASIEEALTRASGVVAKAAAAMGLSRQALYRRMERLGIALERRLR